MACIVALVLLLFCSFRPFWFSFSFVSFRPLSPFPESLALSNLSQVRYHSELGHKTNKNAYISSPKSSRRPPNSTRLD